MCFKRTNNFTEVPSSFNNEYQCKCKWEIINVHHIYEHVGLKQHVTNFDPIHWLQVVIGNNSNQHAFIWQELHPLELPCTFPRLFLVELLGLHRIGCGPGAKHDLDPNIP